MLEDSGQRSNNLMWTLINDCVLKYIRKLNEDSILQKTFMLELILDHTSLSVNNTQKQVLLACVEDKLLSFVKFIKINYHWHVYDKISFQAHVCHYCKLHMMSQKADKCEKWRRLPNGSVSTHHNDFYEWAQTDNRHQYLMDQCYDIISILHTIGRVLKTGKRTESMITYQKCANACKLGD